MEDVLVKVVRRIAEKGTVFPATVDADGNVVDYRAAGFGEAEGGPNAKASWGSPLSGVSASGSSRSRARSMVSRHTDADSLLTMSDGSDEWDRFGRQKRVRAATDLSGLDRIGHTERRQKLLL